MLNTNDTDLFIFVTFSQFPAFARSAFVGVISLASRTAFLNLTPYGCIVKARRVNTWSLPLAASRAVSKVVNLAGLPVFLPIEPVANKYEVYTFAAPVPVEGTPSSTTTRYPK